MTIEKKRVLLLIKPEVHGDKRGFFMEAFNARELKRYGVDKPFVQDNHSRSGPNVVRGLHFQQNKPQGKLVQVLSGEVFDVILDLRKNSDSFGDWMGITLSAENRKQVWIPPGFAHGFLVLSEIAEFFYKVTDYWSKDDERCIKWDDEKIGIEFPNKPKNISESDQKGTSFADADYFL